METPMPKHLKREATDADLRRNPLIGGSKGTRIAGVTTDDLQEFQPLREIPATIPMPRPA